MNCHWRLRPHLDDVRGARKVNVFGLRTAKTPTRHYTMVLLVCRRCGRIRTVEVDGHWTVGEVVASMQGKWGTE